MESYSLEAGERRAIRNLEDLKLKSSLDWRSEVALRRLDRLLVTEALNSPIHAQALSEWHRLRDKRMKGLSSEIWLASKLKEAGAKWQFFAGVTWPHERMVRVRQAITDAHLAETKCGTRRGKDVTFSQVFELIYSEPL